MARKTITLNSVDVTLTRSTLLIAAITLRDLGETALADDLFARREVLVAAQDEQDPDL